jgi:Spy/CpxP family protein refolding chaperone
MPISSIYSKLLLVGCLVCATTPFALAQGGRGGPGGPGGFGGGGRAGGGGLLSLLRMEEVRKELKIDDDQKKELESSSKEMQDAMREMFSGFGQRGGGGGAPDEAARQKMQEGMTKMREMQEKVEDKLEDVLDPKQMDRLLGLFVQRDEVRSLTNKLVMARLKISADQKTKMEDLEKAAGDAMRSAFTGGGRPDEASREKMRATMKENEEKILAVLTDEQKKSMEDLKGAKFEFPAPQFGPGGPGGPGGQGRRGPGN